MKSYSLKLIGCFVLALLILAAPVLFVYSVFSGWDVFLQTCLCIGTFIDLLFVANLLLECSEKFDRGGSA
jgi:hypothetical protein